LSPLALEHPADPDAASPHPAHSFGEDGALSPRRQRTRTALLYLPQQDREADADLHRPSL